MCFSTLTSSSSFSDKIPFSSPKTYTVAVLQRCYIRNAFDISQFYFQRVLFRFHAIVLKMAPLDMRICLTGINKENAFSSFRRHFLSRKLNLLSFEQKIKWWPPSNMALVFALNFLLHSRKLAFLQRTYLKCELAHFKSKISWEK